MLGKPPNKYCFLIGQRLVMSSLYETHICDVITLSFLVLKCLHQFCCSSPQKQGSPSTIMIKMVYIRSYLMSLVFGENCSKIDVNTSGPERIKWWHHKCVSHKVMTSPISVQSESSICWGVFPTSWIFIKNPLVTSSLFAFQIKYFHSPRLFHTALSNTKARQVRSSFRNYGLLVTHKGYFFYRTWRALFLARTAGKLL